MRSAAGGGGRGVRPRDFSFDVGEENLCVHALDFLNGISLLFIVIFLYGAASISIAVVIFLIFLSPFLKDDVF